MIPTEVYDIACALEGVNDSPCEAAIADAWLVYNGLTKRGYTFQRDEPPAVPA